MRKVVVTGMGTISPLGINIKNYWDSLIKGENGIDHITLIDTSDQVVKFAGEAKNYDVNNWFEKKEARKIDRFAQFAIVAADIAIKDADIDIDKIEKERAGVITGSGIGGMGTFEREFYKLFSKGPKRVSPFFIPMMIPDISPGFISIKYGFKGPNYSTSSACASSSHAIGNAFRSIKYGESDIVITGGSEACVTRMSLAGFSNMKALSTRNDDIYTASRPFDKDRDGFVMGEGAGILILESEEHAKKRGAHIYAEITGIGFSGDAYHITSPGPGGYGAAISMKSAIKEAGIKPDQIDYINAHGTSTPPNDKNETLAIKTVFGDHAYKLAINSTKSMIGHLLGASGSLELIATILSINHNKIHPTINYTTPDPDCDLNYTPNKAIDKEIYNAISNSFGFGGHNATLAVRKYLM